jgi:hypothetical protein
MLDEDYYGRGVCKWEFTGAGAMLKATGAEEETRFLSFIEAAPSEGETETRHYPRSDYPRVNEIPTTAQAARRPHQVTPLSCRIRCSRSPLQ